ncbi:MAG: ethylbenzene dehydrogenase-related protein, partial [Gallionella sp.]|nr:ethylbenzene dehydrogenase-related protein [Gallionella sp.]
EKTTPTTFFLVPNIIGGERFFRPSDDTITVRALYNDKMVAMLLEWDDRTQSIPGVDLAEKLADAPIEEDGVAVQLPVVIPKEMQKPYFGMGDAAHPVNIWHWKSGTKDATETISLLNSKGFKEIEKRNATEAGLKAKASYSNGTWKVVISRPLTTPTPETDIQFVEGRFIPVAFAAWDGSNFSEKGSKHTLTTWYWLLLKPATGSKPLITALIVAGLFVGGLLWWAHSARKPAA